MTLPEDGPGQWEELPSVLTDLLTDCVSLGNAVYHSSLSFPICYMKEWEQMNSQNPPNLYILCIWKGELK